MTPITSKVSRSCPAIQNPEGRELHVTLDDTEGGSLHLKWKGLRKDAEVEVSLADLMHYAEHGVPGVDDTGSEPVPETVAASPGTGLPKSVDKTQWCKFDDLLSRAHIHGELDMSTRLILIAMIKDLRLHHEWLESGAKVSWESYKTKSNTDE